MKATLKMINIGNIQGEQIFEFESGEITIIVGPNMSGKSRTIKAIATIEAFPIKSKFLQQEALRLGVGNSLINYDEEDAEIELIYSSQHKHLKMTRNEEYETNTEGNENFLYSSMLVQNSRILENITYGNSDFSWIVKEMSLAKNYDIVLRILKSYDERISDFLIKIQENDSLIVEKIKKKDDIINKINEINQKIKKLNNEINALIEIDPKKKKRYDDLEAEIKEYGEELRKQEKFNRKLEVEIEKQESTIQSLNTKVESLKKNISKLKDRYKRLKEIEKEKDELNKEIKDFLKRKNKLTEPKVNLELDIKYLKNKIKFKICPTCGQSMEIFDTKDLESEIEEKNKKLKKIIDEINSLAEETKEREKKLKESEKLQGVHGEIASYAEQISNINRKNEENEKKKNLYKLDYEEKVKQFNEDKETLEGKIKEYEELKKKIAVSEKFIKISDEKSKLTNELGSFTIKEGNLKNEIEILSEIDLWGIKINDNKISKTILNKLKNELLEVYSFVELNSKEQKQGVAINFNENIEKVSKVIGFRNIKKIMLGLENYELKVFQKDKKQQILSNLSSSEKGIIAGILQISLKETYYADNPFFIGDEVIHSLDKTRVRIFLDYLKSLAKKYDWFVIFTQISDEEEVKDIRIIHYR